ncbi:hypothetical protein GC175_30520 [bacterium]|nr:hypothetical protein [bacterium]
MVNRRVTRTAQSVQVDGGLSMDDDVVLKKTQHIRLIHTLNLTVLAVTSIFVLFPMQFPPAAVVIGLALLLVPVILRKLLLGRFTAASAANWPVAFILFVMTPVSVWVSPVPETTWPFLVRLLWGGALFFAVVNWPRGERELEDGGALPRHLQQLTVVYVGLGVVVTAIDSFILYLPYRIPGVADLNGNRLGWFGSRLAEAVVHQLNENQLAGVAILYIPLLLTMLFAPAVRNTTARNTRGAFEPVAPPPVEWFRAFCGVSLIYFLSVLLLSGSRGGQIATILALGIVPLLLSRRTRILAVIIGVIGVGVILWIGPLRLVNSVAVLGRDAAPATTVVEAVLTDRNLQGRFMIWERAVHAIADNPLTGVGLGAFGYVAEQPYPKLANFQPDPDIGYAHNIWLQAGVDLGVPGLLALVVLTLIIVKNFWRQLIQSGHHSQYRYFYVASLSSLSAFLIWGTLDAVSIGSLDYLPLWYLYGLSVTSK